MGNGCFNSQGHQQSASYQISHGDESQLSIFYELGKKQSQISYPLKLDTLDNFEDCFFQKEFAFIEPVVSYLVEATTQTIALNIEDRESKCNNVSTQTKNIVQKVHRPIEQIVSQSPSKLHQSEKQQGRQSRASPQNTYKTAMKKAGNLIGIRQNRNSCNSLEKQFDLSPYQKKRYLIANQKNVRFADSKFSLPVL